MSENASVFFSIIVPTYNRADLIVKTLQSLQKQSYEHYEVIIVDDGSTDNTEDIIRVHATERIRYIKKEHAERSAARNYGAQLAKGKYVNFFDSDDLALSNHLSGAVSLINKYKEPAWFHLSYEFVDESGVKKRSVPTYKEETLNKKLIKGNILSCNGVFIRKDILLANKFNEALSTSEDYELWCRLAARYPLYYSNTITSLIVEHTARSVRHLEPDVLVKKINMFLFSIRNDEQIKKFFGKEFGKMEMAALSHISLHLSENKQYKKKSFEYLIQALKKSLSLIMHRRFLAIVRNLLLR